MKLAARGKEHSFDKLKGLQNIGPNIFENNSIPSYCIKRLQITEKGNSVGNIEFIQSVTEVITAAIAVLICVTKIIIDNNIRKQTIEFFFMFKSFINIINRNMDKIHNNIIVFIKHLTIFVLYILFMEN